MAQKKKGQKDEWKDKEEMKIHFLPGKRFLRAINWQFDLPYSIVANHIQNTRFTLRISSDFLTYPSPSPYGASPFFFKPPSPYFSYYPILFPLSILSLHLCSPSTITHLF